MKKQLINNQVQVHDLLNKLIRKIRNFAVIDKEGLLIGRVRDLIIDYNHKVNIIVTSFTSLPSLQSSEHHSYLLLPSKLIKKIDIATKSVFLDIDKSHIKHMPEYSQSPMTNNNNLENSNIEPVMSTAPDMNLEQNEIGEKTEEEIIRLLSERLIVNKKKRKIGDVIVRKEIETRMVQVPVQYEKLVIEQVSPENKLLAEFALGQEEISGVELSQVEKHEVDLIDINDHNLTVSGDFNSPKIASLLLNAIALERNHGCQKVRVTIVVENEEYQKKYEEWFERTSIK
ncbi:YsnF/AvaK domain-containing protein [Pelatocladus sp. BLCC-F211]|uniref:YsnF/AvaK domain-containing protein n=1 Tax=Pelatocladus sp. BLCC-F211 TaxID=3342752 RepID=UPI0035B9EA2B